MPFGVRSVGIMEQMGGIMDMVTTFVAVWFDLVEVAFKHL